MLQQWEINLKNLQISFFLYKDEEVQILDIPPEKRQIHTETYDFNVETLVKNFEDEDIFIPSFQKIGLWTNKFALKQLSKIITLFLIVIKCK
ncbi:hypothetical protein [Desulfonema magnum]|uniref:Uncharacterized protein n=1 Tax=Desulfonema magnum TaxID=45655 RepID=A0A975BIJ8_9BACT|nr:hypothetical protein [Desulfonema magnum]QTA85940.1 Uncharacterized protein dnm_019570 [Desulfonema magnum]